MKLIFTGASGFLGNNIRPLLERMYDVTTVGLTQQDNYTVNIAQEIPILHKSYDIVFRTYMNAMILYYMPPEKPILFLKRTLNDRRFSM